MSLRGAIKKMKRSHTPRKVKINKSERCEFWANRESDGVFQPASLGFSNPYPCLARSKTCVGKSIVIQRSPVSLFRGTTVGLIGCTAPSPHQPTRGPLIRWLTRWIALRNAREYPTTSNKMVDVHIE